MSAVDRFGCLVPYDGVHEQQDTLLTKFPIEIWEMIVEQIQLQGTSFKPIALFAATCKMAFNLVYFSLRSSPSFCLSNRLFATQHQGLIANNSSDHDKLLGYNYSIRFLGHDKNQCLYFVALGAEGQPSSLLIRYNLTTRTRQDIFLKNHAKECSYEGLAILETHFYDEGLLVITKAGWTRFAFTEEGIAYKGFYSPFCKEDLKSEEIHCASIEGDSLRLTVMRDVDGSTCYLELYDLDFKNLSSGFAQVKPRALTALAPTGRIRFTEVNLQDTQASNKTWRVLAHTNKVDVFKQGKDPYAPSVATINLAKEFKRPIVRLAEDFLFVFQRSDGSSTQRDQIQCSLFYLPTSEELASPLDTLFTLPEGHELFEVALKEEKGLPTLVYMTHKIDGHQGTNSGVFMVHEVGFKAVLPPKKDEEKQETEVSDDEEAKGDDAILGSSISSTPPATTVNDELYTSSTSTTSSAPFITTSSTTTPHNPNWFRISAVAFAIFGGGTLLVGGGLFGTLYTANVSLVISATTAGALGITGTVMVVVAPLLWLKGRKTQSSS